LKDVRHQVAEASSSSADIHGQRRFVLFEVVQPATSKKTGVVQQLAKGDLPARVDS